MTDFVYTTYIQTTPEKLWAALTNPEFTKQYWGDTTSDWKKGADWKLAQTGSGQTLVVGKVLESVPPKRLVYSWVDPDDKNEVSQVTFEIETIDGMVKLSVAHDHFKPGSTMAPRVAGGWPRVLTSIKSFLETGTALPAKAPCATAA
jgi:uncharacterized protein YndB with AHSA1/START domain